MEMSFPSSYSRGLYTILISEEWDTRIQCAEIEMPEPVNTKRDFVERYKRGEFGNCSPTWETLEDFSASGYRGLVHLRNRVAGGPTWYNVPHDEVKAVFDRVTHYANPVENPNGAVPPTDLYFSGMAPTAKTLVQGEVMLSDQGWYFNHSFVKKPMRDALREQSLHAEGIMAVHLLKSNLCPNSWDWLNVLLDRYPGHIVEVSAYGEQWGTLAPLYNTCFWEVRNY